MGTEFAEPEKRPEPKQPQQPRYKPRQEQESRKYSKPLTAKERAQQQANRPGKLNREHAQQSEIYQRFLARLAEAGGVLQPESNVPISEDAQPAAPSQSQPPSEKADPKTLPQGQNQSLIDRIRSNINAFIASSPQTTANTADGSPQLLVPQGNKSPTPTIFPDKPKPTAVASVKLTSSMLAQANQASEEKGPTASQKTPVTQFQHTLNHNAQVRLQQNRIRLDQSQQRFSNPDPKNPNWTTLRKQSNIVVDLNYRTHYATHQILEIYRKATGDQVSSPFPLLSTESSPEGRQRLIRQFFQKQLGPTWKTFGPQITPWIDKFYGADSLRDLMYANEPALAVLTPAELQGANTPEQNRMLQQRIAGGFDIARDSIGKLEKVLQNDPDSNVALKFDSLIGQTLSSIKDPQPAPADCSLDTAETESRTRPPDAGHDWLCGIELEWIGGLCDGIWSDSSGLRWPRDGFRRISGAGGLQPSGRESECGAGGWSRGQALDINESLSGAGRLPDVDGECGAVAAGCGNGDWLDSRIAGFARSGTDIREVKASTGRAVC